MHPALCWKDAFGVAIWAGGFMTEVLADRQKSQWRKDKTAKKHDEDWISSGLWSKSRHPNYFGPISPPHHPFGNLRSNS